MSSKANPGNGDVGVNRKIGSVMVVGGGIGAMQASLDLANAGFKVYLVERTPSIGGRMAQLDKTFPTNDCSMCTISPKLVECGKHLNIDLITYSEVQSIEGTAGNFTAKVKCKAKSVDYSKCTGCGLCQEKCPTKVDSEFEAGIGKRKAIYVPYPQAVPNKPVIDREHCLKFTKNKCGVCQKKCPTSAINYEDQDKVIELKVGSVILATGYDTVDPKLRPEYGFGRYKNVITSLQYERLLSASGPTHGHIQRPSDTKAPHKIAWIQCVGSRDAQCGNEYCSSVCCMYATKEAIMTAEHEKGVECSIFFNDIRAFGKGFERYYIGAERDSGVKYVRGIISTVREMQRTKNLLAKYVSDDGVIKEEEFELVILSVGLRPSKGSKELAELAGIKLDSHGYALTSSFRPNETTRTGVFALGAFLAPMDIPETVMTASSAAAAAAELIAEERGTLVAEKQYPSERDIMGQRPRVGVFVCRCGTNIARVVDVPKVVEYAKTLPYVEFATESLFTCSTDSQKTITKAIEEHNLNRVIVAACTPATHEPLFQDTLKEAGLNKFLFEMANIRNQCSWVHENAEMATEKSKDLVRMAVARALELESIKQLQSPVTAKALVIGGGLSGMTAALSLARQGFESYLVERSPKLGGYLNRLQYTIEGDNAQEWLKKLVGEVQSEKRIKVFTNAELTEFSGHVGSFHASIKTANKVEKVDAGAVIVATGAQEYQPNEYLYGKTPNVLTQLELEEKVVKDPDALRKANTIVMIQCVGSRDDEHVYCSRVCCGQAVKNALKLKELSPAAKIYVLHRDIRTYASKELAYKKAREKGVLFLRYDPEHRPEVAQTNGRLSVRAQDVSIGAVIDIKPDIIVLSAGIKPHETNSALSSLLKVPLDRDGFYLEAHLKLRPLDFSSEGIFLCGLAHSPKYIEESVAQARGAASRAANLLSKDFLTVGGVISVVNPEKCVACLTCVRVCPYGVPAFKDEEGAVYIEPASCQGCGICAGVCPNKAIEVQHYKDRQVIAKCKVLCAK